MTKKDEESSKSIGGHQVHDDALSARRARLRTSLTKPLSADENQVELSEHVSGGIEVQPENIKKASLSQAIEKMGKNLANEETIGQAESLVLLGHIDQALNYCAGHLASLQNVASKQVEELKLIAETLQSRVANDSGQSLIPLVESLTAAIEPMKAMGELVPILDRLANATEERDQFFVKADVSNDKLVISLAQQLSTGNIDAATFKSAYQALFPDVDPVHRLGELLDAQQLSGELFQAAFQALQSNQSIADSDSSTEDSNSISQQFVFDEEAKKEFLLKEEELSNKLAEKELEIKSIREQLDSRWQELATQCEELKVALQDREEILQDRETELNKKINELSAKNSENQQLKAQIEELKDRTKEMMTDLQKQLAVKQDQEIVRKQQVETVKKQEEEKARQSTANVIQQSPQSGFFDFVSTGNSSNTLFNANPPSLFSDEPSGTEIVEAAVVENIEEASKVSGWQMASSKSEAGFLATNNASQGQLTNSGSFTVASPSALPSDAAQSNTQAAAAFVSAAGSYGSGVRAQVFEVIVRQALAGTQWREICAVPMQSNNISAQEVEAEVKRRQALLKK